MTPPVGPTWEFIPPIDPLITTVVVAVLIVLAANDLRRGLHGSSVGRFIFRFGGLGAIGVILAGPGYWIVPSAPDKPELSILVDRSRSMGVLDETGCTRLDAMKREWLSPAALRELESAANFSLVAFDDVSQTVSLADVPLLAPEGRASRVVGAAAQAIARVRRHANVGSKHLLLLSDGVDTDGRTLASLSADAAAAGTRGHVVLPGEGAADELRLEARFDRAWVRSGEQADLRIDIFGAREGDGLLTIREAPEGPIVDRRSVQLGPRRSIEVKVLPSVRVDTGGVALARYIVRIEPAGASSGAPAPSEASAAVQVVGGRLRVALFESHPSWDTRFFVDALAAEPDIELTTVYALDGPGRAFSGAPARLRVTRIIPGLDSITRTLGDAAPITPDALEVFDLFVFGRGLRGMLSPGSIARVRELVEGRGRAALFLRGPDQREAGGWTTPFIEAPLERSMIAPVISLREEIAPRGGDVIRVPVATLLAGELSPAATILATANELPLIVETPLGFGRIGAVLSDGWWRSSMQDEQRAIVRGMWVGLARRLESGADVPPEAAASLALDRTESAPGESVKVIVRARAAGADMSGAELVVIGPEGGIDRRTLTPDATIAGKWSAHIGPALAGDYLVRLMLPESASEGAGRALETMLAVRERDIEMRDVSPRRDDAEAIALATSGRVWPLDGFGAFVEHLRRESIAREGTPRFEAVWDDPWVLVAIVALLAGEWWWRRKEGLA